MAEIADRSALARIADGVIDALPPWLRRSGKFVVSAGYRADVLAESRRRRRGEPRLGPDPVRRVLVICHGNICRSPFAGRLLALHCPGLEVRSAGLEAREGKPAEPGALRIGARFGVSLADHGAHRMDADDARWADLILGMEGHHAHAVGRRWPEARERALLLGDFLAEPPYRIDDPWGCEDAVFERTFLRIERAVLRLAQVLERRAG